MKSVMRRNKYKQEDTYMVKSKLEVAVQSRFHEGKHLAGALTLLTASRRYE